MADLPSIKDLLARRQQATAAPSVTATPPPTVSSPSPSPIPSIPTPPREIPPVGGKSLQSPSPSQTPHLAENDEVDERFTEKMEKINRREKEDEAGRKAQALGIPTIDLKGFPISPEALTLVPEAQAAELKALVFLYTGNELRVAAVEPDNPKVKELLFQLNERHKTNGKIYLVSEDSFNQGLKLYAALPKIAPIVKGVEITEDELAKYQAQMTDISSIEKTLASSNVTDILTIVIAASVKLGSSDIHIEAEESGIIVRFRIDGMLQQVAKIDSEQWKKIINRIKLIASLKINVNNQAQDGRFTIFQQKKQIDVRVSTIPTSYGESVVMRLLNPDTIALEFDTLGFRAAALKKITREIERPNGMIVTTGPTGSGKTTTLYAILRRLNTKDVKIITLEDPVEYKLEGINQSQIDASRDYTFAKGLRSILRQDPDIVMVGEIRDLETAETAIQASLTGHLLLSTIHTNDAAGAIPRFLSMGVAPHLLAPAINAILGQRLLRKLCKDCKTQVTLDADTLELVKKHTTSIPEKSGEKAFDPSTVTWYGPGKGCTTCGNSGYKGRVGIYEVLVKDPVLEQAILKSNGALSEYEMRDIAKEQGMISMAQDGLLKAAEGLTSIEEIQRIAGL